MDDVFETEFSVNDLSELEIGSRDWDRRLREVETCGQREGAFVGRQTILQHNFEAGVDVGFKIVCDLATYRGKLLAKLSSSSSEQKVVIDSIIQSISDFENELMTKSSNTFSSEYLQEISMRKQEIMDRALIFEKN